MKWRAWFSLKEAQQQQQQERQRENWVILGFLCSSSFLSLTTRFMLPFLSSRSVPSLVSLHYIINEWWVSERMRNEWASEGGTSGEFSFTRLICFVLFAHFQWNDERMKREMSKRTKTKPCKKRTNGTKELNLSEKNKARFSHSSLIVLCSFSL